MPNIRQNFNKRIANVVKNPNVERCIMGLPDGTIETGEEFIIWVIGADGNPFKAINRTVANQPGRFVDVGYHPFDMPTRQQVFGYSDVYGVQSQIRPAAGPHAPTHRYGEYDCDWVQRERILFVVPVAGENKVDIYPDAKQKPDGSWWWNRAALRFDYSSYIPATGTLISVLALDSTGAIVCRVGTPIALRSALTAADFPALAAGDSGLCGLILYAGMKQARRESGNDDFIDLSTSGANGGGTSTILAIAEMDGVPLVSNVVKIKFPNGSVTDAGSGIAEIAFPNIDTLTGSAAADDGDVLTVVSGSAVFQPPAVPTTLMLTVSEDLTAQIDGVTDTFALPLASEHVTVYCNLRLLPNQVILNDSGLAFTLDFVPAVGMDNLIVEMDVYLSQLLLTESGKPLTNGNGEYLYA